MTNEKLKEIKERLLTENDKRRRMEQEQANACANYYERGVNDALTAVSFARPEQQNQPASGEWLNIDGDYTFAACSICETAYEVATEEEAEKGLWDAFMCSYRYCPNCGAKMDENEVENLKRCSCGDRYYCPEVEKGENGKWFIRCHMCHRIVWGDTIEEAADKWNRRAE